MDDSNSLLILGTKHDGFALLLQPQDGDVSIFILTPIFKPGKLFLKDNKIVVLWIAGQRPEGVNELSLMTPRVLLGHGRRQKDLHALSIQNK